MEVNSVGILDSIGIPCLSSGDGIGCDGPEYGGGAWYVAVSVEYHRGNMLANIEIRHCSLGDWTMIKTI